MTKTNSNKAEQESIRALMTTCWRDHQKTRDQTWKALQIEATLAAGLIAVRFNFPENEFAIILAGLLPILLGIFGVQITMHHRKYQQEKFKIIQKCEEKLYLAQLVIPFNKERADEHCEGKKDCPIQPGEVSDIKWWHPFSPFVKPNTPLFIIRMHYAIIIFSIVFIISSLLESNFFSFLQELDQSLNYRNFTNL